MTLSVAAGPMPAPAPPERWLASDVICPEGTELERAESPRGDRSALWCELRRGGKVARHGPYLELYAGGSTARQGYYHRGGQLGPWAEWEPDGTLRRSLRIWPGEAGPHLPHPDDVCPEGSRRDRSYGHDDEERMWSECLAPGPDGELVRAGPYVTWSVLRGAGGTRLALREIAEYRDGRPHGLRRVYESPRPGQPGGEVVVLEENSELGERQGESRAFFFDGTLREVTHYRDSMLDGGRRAFWPSGEERWRARYDGGGLVEVEGDLEVGGQPCADRNLPVFTPDGLEEHCQLRYGASWGTPHGAYVRYDASGSVIERGLYAHGKKVEIWEAPPGSAPLPPPPSDLVIAEGRFLVGSRPLSELTAAVPDLWFRDNRTRKFLSPEIEITDDRLRVAGLPPGSYYLGVTVDADPGNPERHPGDFTGSLDFEVAEGEVTALDVQLLETLHLTEPWDNRRPIPGFGDPCDAAPILLPRVRFAWKPPADPGGSSRTEYVYTVSRMRCDPFTSVRRVSETVFDPEVELVLPPTGAGEVYTFHLGARRGGVHVGHLMTFGEEGQGYGWDLRFRVAEPPSEDP